MVGSMQLCAITSYITANIAPIPLFWVLPLGVYLLTIIVAFEFPRLLPRGIVTRFLAVMLGGLGYMLSHVGVTLPAGIGIAFFLVELFVACLFCHCEAYALRPNRTSESTVFYLLFAGGGALGSFLVGIVFPLVFSFNYDVALTFAVTAMLALAATWKVHWGQRLLWSAASIMMLVLVVWLHIAYQRNTIAAVRNFYGALRVKQDYSELSRCDGADTHQWLDRAWHADLRDEYCREKLRRLTTLRTRASGWRCVSAARDGPVPSA